MKVSYTSSDAGFCPLDYREKKRGHHTNRNHALAVIVQILHQRLAQTVHLPLPALRMVPRQEPALLLQAMHQMCQLLHDALVRAEVLLLGQHDAEIEDELIAVVARRLHADRVPEDAIPARAYLQQITAELLPGNHEEGDIGEGEDGLLLRRGRRGGDDGAIRDLMDDLGA